MTTTEIVINIAISISAGAVSGYSIFKFLGKKWVENWFAKDLKRYEYKLDVLKASALVDELEPATFGLGSLRSANWATALLMTFLITFV